MAKALHRLNEVERQIFERARKGDVNPFTDYYLRGPMTGTWWLPGDKRPNFRKGYETLLKAWRKQGKTASVEVGEVQYAVYKDHDRSRDYPDLPAFHHHHGFIFLPWQLEFHNDRTPVRTLLGGYGSGKTMSMVASLLIHAATLPGFRAFGLAPQSKQANEIYRLARQLTAGTLYEQRFVLGAPASPNGRIEVGNDFVMASDRALPNTIECYPILNQEDSLLTLTGDCAIVDQAEKFEDLGSIIREIGTRFRGRDMATGRERLGTITFIANSEDNQSLWDIYDMAEEDPKNYKSYSPSTYDNPGLTERDIQRYEMQVGGDKESIRVHLMGGRPLGNGKQFSKAVMELMRDPSLDAEMHSGLLLERPGYTMLVQKLVGPIEWLLPYNPNRRYLVISDPGTENAPNRNSPCIFVWDITDFPGQRQDMKPARLVGFVWGGGNGDIKNWANRYHEMVHRYHAIATNGFDATGFQAGYDQWLFALQDLLAEKITLAGNNKAMCLNAAKMLASRGLMKMPAEISGIYAQLMRYDLPEPANLKQDLVMAFIMSAWWLMRLFYMTVGDPNEAPPIPIQESQDDRYARPTLDRYETPYPR